MPQNAPNHHPDEEPLETASPDESASGADSPRGGSPARSDPADLSSPAGQPAIALPAGTVLREEYEVEEVLGTGSFGITYRAHDRHLQADVAIKEYYPRQIAGRTGESLTVRPHSAGAAEDFEYGLQQFMEEGRTVARFDHPNVVDVRSYFEGNGTGYLVMSYYEGRSLSEHLEAQDGRLPEPEAVSLIQDVLDGLGPMHKADVLHRDIGPSNVYRKASGDALLIDFGAAREAVGTRSQTLSTILTPGYAPIEQYTGDNQGPWTDVYACAGTLYQCLTGRAPPEATERMQNDRLAPPREIRPEISLGTSLAVMKGLALYPDQRPDSAEAFSTLLGEDEGTGLQTVAPATVQGGDEHAPAAPSEGPRPDLSSHPSGRDSPSGPPAEKETGESQRGVFAELAWRRVPQIVLAYLGGSWTVFRFIQWFTQEAGLPPETPTAALIGFACFVPTVAFVAYRHGRAGIHAWSRLDVAALSINFLLASGIAFMNVSSADSSVNRSSVETQTPPSDETELTISARPGGPPAARILRGGEQIGVTPFRRTVPGDTVSLRIKKPGHGIQDTTLYLGEKESDSISVTFARAQASPRWSPTQPSPTSGPNRPQRSSSSAADEQPTADASSRAPTATLKLDGPPNGTIRVNGDPRPLDSPLSLPPRDHRIECNHPESEVTLDTTVTVRPDTPAALTCRFSHRVAVGTGDDDPWGKVYLDGRETGETTTEFARELGPGTHEIRVDIRRGTYRMVGGEHRWKKGNETHSSSFSGSTATITLRPSFRKQSHKIQFDVEGEGPR
jgi:serine/threonine protein kinase